MAEITILYFEKYQLPTRIEMYSNYYYVKQQSMTFY